PGAALPQDARRSEFLRGIRESAIRSDRLIQLRGWRVELVTLAVAAEATAISSWGFMARREVAPFQNRPSEQLLKPPSELTFSPPPSSPCPPCFPSYPAARTRRPRSAATQRSRPQTLPQTSRLQPEARTSPTISPRCKDCPTIRPSKLALGKSATHSDIALAAHSHPTAGAAIRRRDQTAATSCAALRHRSS